MTELFSESLVRVELPHREHVRALLDDMLWGRLTRRIVLEYPGLYLPAAERVMNEALGFLRLLAQEPRAGYALSPRVGVGWHVFVLHTREYAAFCAGLAGRFLHHTPRDEDGTSAEAGQRAGGVVRTLAAMRARGLAVDEALWFGMSTGTCCVGYAEEVLA
ncbi:hypothetical protein GCM10009555_001350 [Acrocarpospora macrocephala]|uniref:Uncharacterized protein n=1 Tax=Acrocarpospora macrocephala TaxID=150177 RepID=A0A5M3XAY0_9ACTN|nr:hypothetical protein [Acrocarpospora macrocephala]GES15228.1 hypothetical protein Amac_088250 [Acrocarpospora macrocephala]